LVPNNDFFFILFVAKHLPFCSKKKSQATYIVKETFGKKIPKEINRREKVI
jgi:hypothetical protein